MAITSSTGGSWQNQRKAPNPGVTLQGNEKLLTNDASGSDDCSFYHGFPLHYL